MLCCICGKKIPMEIGGWKEGHNAQPVEDGRCCGDCNRDLVVPERIKVLGKHGGGQK